MTNHRRRIAEITVTPSVRKIVILELNVSNICSCKYSSFKSIIMSQRSLLATANRFKCKQTASEGNVALGGCGFASNDLFCLCFLEKLHIGSEVAIYLCWCMFGNRFSCKAMWTLHHRKARRPVNEARCWRCEDKRNQSRRSSGFLSSLSTAASSCQ